ncbi:MAG: DNA polymerase III subunit gamma/tau [Burkholderiales bacterium]
MSYQVLARKWRPRSFGALVGQDHVVRALSHALESGRLHHAYLFTGTRGIGKTTIARILAKSFNCDTGITPNPCGVCPSCTEIDSGRFVDLLEVDAATNTRVEEMRQLLENAVYAPTRGRFKVYVIDEVHMLSNSAFNAMLKTLEEPPEHIKFILATTDPQKIPVTVLSRCLQFNLKQMPSAAIATHLTGICEKESVTAEGGALQMIAHAARGSMRDALSLLDQAIAFCAGNVQTEAVRSMLGTVDRGFLVSILEYLAAGNLQEAVAVANDIQARSLSFDEALAALATLLHNIALVQAVPEIELPDGLDDSRVRVLSNHLDAETVQLYYQIALHGRRDLALAPDEFAGFTMTLMRMALFRPDAGASSSMPNTGPIGATRALSSAPAGPASRLAPTKSTPTPATTKATAPAAIQTAPITPATPSISAEPAVGPFDGNWPDLVRSLKLGGLARQLADRSELVQFDAGKIVLTVSPQDRALTDKPFLERLRQALAERLGHPVHLELRTGATTGASVAASDEAARQSRTGAAQTMMQEDPFVRALVSGFDARIESIKSLS